MKQALLLSVLFFSVFNACKNRIPEEHIHEGEASGLEPLAFTLYSENVELFVEFSPLVAGKLSGFASHFTVLGDSFLPLTEGKITLSLLVGDKGIRNMAENPSSPGIFRLALKPVTAGPAKLVFDIETKTFTDRIVIENLTVYPDEQAAIDNPQIAGETGDIVFFKEQAWKMDFANYEVKKQSFSHIIKTSGQILHAPGDERIIISGANGIVKFSGNRTVTGKKVENGTDLFSITGGVLTDGNIDLAYKEARLNYDKARADYERAGELVKNHIISEKDFLQIKTEYEKAQNAYNIQARNYSSVGQIIKSPVEGFIKNIQVKEGQYVEAGTPLAVISANKKLLLQADVSQRYVEYLPSVSGAHFKLPGITKTFNTEDLNARMVSFGRSLMEDSPWIPITFEMDNKGDMLPGSVAEVYLKSGPVSEALLVPVSCLMEEQGIFYVYVQTAGERFQKREVKTGLEDGIFVQVLKGLAEGERVVSKGSSQIKVSTASGSLPAHGHEH